MKRGKDEEKILEPMFPRLHVNDADKGGPRAPPRNKMALYEQLSIPSQRFSDHGTSRSNTNTFVPPGPSSQPVERNLTAQHLGSSTAVHRTDKFVSQMSMENVRSLAHHSQRKTVTEEDDFSVPVFVNSKRFQSQGGTKSGTEKDKHPTLTRDQVAGSSLPGAFVTSLDISATEERDLEKSASSCDRVNDCIASLRNESGNRLNRDGGETRVKDTDNGVISHLVIEIHSKGHGSPDDADNGREYCRSRKRTSVQEITEEENDGVSDDSMVGSVCSIDISPDDVVEVIGQKRFWSARKAIANQQRVFALQLFELHRLIKVQKLIAASPDLLLDDINYLGKVSGNSYPVKKLLPSEFTVKPPLPQVVVKHSTGDSEKTDQNKMECSAENVVGKSSNHPHHQPSNHMPFSNPPASPSVNGCCFPQPPPSGNQQWLIPVMSPSEGLIYKPHPGMGHTGPVCGGYYGNFMPAPMMMGNFMGNGPPPPYHPGVGFPYPGNGYFPPYGIMPPMMNPYYSGQQQQQQQPNEQMNQFTHTGNLQNSPTLNTAAAQEPPTKSYPRARKSREGGSTGSSPNDPEGIFGKNSFQPFLAVDDDDNNNNRKAPEEMVTTTTTTTTVTQTTRDGQGVTRVIKVVPHNAKRGSENAARIFRSIQEERKHYDASYSNP